jgi:hypothetical protein
MRVWQRKRRPLPAHANLQRTVRAVLVGMGPTSRRLAGRPARVVVESRLSLSTRQSA